MQTNILIRYTIITGLIAILFLPFVVANSQFFPFITGKGFLFRIIVEILFVLWIALIFRDKMFAPKRTYIFWAVLLFTAIIGIADLFGVMPYKSFWSNYERMEGYITLLHLAAYFLIASSVLITEKSWAYFFNFSIVSSVLMTFFCFAQLAGKFTINQGGVRVDGTFGNATYLAVFLLINFFITLWYFVKNKNFGAKAFYVVAMVLQFVVLYKTATRGAMLGLIGGLIVATIYVAIFGKKNPLARKISVGALIFLLLLVGGFVLVRKKPFVQNSPVLSRFAAISTASFSRQGRYYIWPMAIKGFTERPILGWGQENFNYVFNKNYDPRMFAEEQWFDRTHNEFLDWLIAGGILGFLSYLSLFVALIYYLIKSQLSVTEKAVILGLFASYVFNNIFVFDNLISYILFFSFLAYFQSIHAGPGKQSFKFIEESQDKPQIGQTAIALSLVVIAFVIYFGNVKPILANKALIKALSPLPGGLNENIDNFEKVFAYNTFGNAEAAEQLLASIGRFINDQTPQDIKIRYADLSIKELQNQLNRAPNDARYQLFLGSMYSRLNKFDEAIPVLKKAVELSPRKQAMYFELAAAQMAKGDQTNVKAGFESYKYAYDLAPDFVDARLAYASAAIMTNDARLASELLAPLPIHVIAFDQRILNALVMTRRLSDVINMLETRISIEPDSPQHHLMLAAAYLDNGQRTKAIQEVRAVIKINPQFKDQGEYYIKEIEAGRNP